LLSDTFDAVTYDNLILDIKNFEFMLNDTMKEEACRGFYKRHFKGGIPDTLLPYCRGGDGAPKGGFAYPLKDTCEFQKRELGAETSSSSSSSSSSSGGSGGGGGGVSGMSLGGTAERNGRIDPGKEWNRNHLKACDLMRAKWVPTVSKHGDFHDVAHRYRYAL
jgi:hypothetical protein